MSSRTPAPPATTTNSLTSIFHSIRRKPSFSSVIQRLLELCVHYEQQANSQNEHPSSSTINFAEVNLQTEKQIKSLVKALAKSKRTGSIDELEKAVMHRDATTHCILVPKTFDIAQRESAKFNCVVAYCRLWRWADLADPNELKPVGYCSHAFQYDRDEICVNPYHYERTPNTYVVYLPHASSSQAARSVSDSAASIIGDSVPQNMTYQSPVELHRSTFSTTIARSLESSQMSMDDETVDAATPMDDDSGQSHQELAISHGGIALEEPRVWCRISYYEMAHRVGEQYSASQSQVIIDGLTHSSNSERFCLGSLNNIHRTNEIDRARRHIGHGVRLYHIHGNVYAECLSENPVFVQSPIANKKQSWHPATVCRIQPHDRFQIFDSEDFADVLACAIQQGYKSVHNLTTMCTIRLSFVKGWGVDYGRPTVTSTPCWIEVHLDGPLKWIDTVITNMRGPNESITSVS